MIEAVDIAAGPFDHEDLFSLIVLQSQYGLLLGRKMRGYAEGKLVLPGGKDRYHLGLGAILLRPGYPDAGQELQEETGIASDGLQLKSRGALTVIDEADGGEIKTISLYAGHVDADRVQLRDSNELTEVGWRSVVDLPYEVMPPDYQTWLSSVVAGYAVHATLYTDGEALLKTTANRAFRLSPIAGVRAEEIPVITA